MKNKSVIIESAGTIRVVGTDIPDPADEEVLIRVSYTALCGSDVKLYRGTYSAPHRYPIVIGHEWVGEIIRSGSSVSENWKVGDSVTGDCSIYCGHCDNCLRNFKNHCDFVEKRGITTDGGCAQYITVNQRHLHKCPELRDMKVFALTEPLAVSVEAVINRIGKNELKKIRNALVIGCGGIGAMAAIMLVEQGIAEITVVDTAKRKLAIVDSFGFENIKTVLTDLSDNSFVENEGYDLIVEAAGSGAALQRAIQIANPCGKIVCVGHQQKNELDFSLVMKKSLTMIASIGSTGGFERAIEIIEKNHGRVGDLISKIVTLDEVEMLFEKGFDGEKDIKILIDLK